jgi:hypothetical protein
MPQNEQTDNSTIISSKQPKPSYKTIANNKDDQIEKLLLIAKDFNIIGKVQPGMKQLYIHEKRLNAIFRDFEAADVELSGLIAWIDDLINSQIFGHKEHKYINKDGSRSVGFDFLKSAIGTKNQKDYQKLRDSSIIKCDYKRGNKQAYRDTYTSEKTLEIYEETITKDSVLTIFNYPKVLRRNIPEKNINDTKRHNLENRNNRLFHTGQGNWDATIRFFQGLNPLLLTTKQLANYQIDLSILIGILTDKNTVYDQETGFVKYRKKHKITDTCNRAFCWSRDVNISKETRRHFFDLPDIVNLDQPGSHLYIFHNHINHIDNHCLFLDKYLNDSDGSFRSMLAGEIGVSQSTVKTMLLSVLNTASLNRHGSIFKVLLSDGDDDVNIEDYTEAENLEALLKLEKFKDLAEGFLRCVQRWHQSIKDNPAAHQKLPNEILDGLSTSSTEFETIVSFHLTGYEQQATLWWAAKVQKALMIPSLNFHDGILLQGKMPDNFLTWGDDLLDISMIEKPL